VVAFHQATMPPQDGVRADQQTQPAQRPAGQRHEKCGERSSGRSRGR
jgi:hypothetical protein